MNREEVALKLNETIDSYLKSVGLELVDLNFRYVGQTTFLKILVDRPSGGISVGECAQINRQIGSILDEQNILQGGYILEVSSPGLDRPLKTKNDFLRCLDRNVRLFLSEPVNGKIEWEGIIQRVDDTQIYIDSEDNLTEIPLDKINRAKQIINDL